MNEQEIVLTYSQPTTEQHKLQGPIGFQCMCVKQKEIVGGSIPRTADVSFAMSALKRWRVPLRSLPLLYYYCFFK
jgi:hypothetical protein